MDLIVNEAACVLSDIKKFIIQSKCAQVENLVALWQHNLAPFHSIAHRMSSRENSLSKIVTTLYVIVSI